MDAVDFEWWRCQDGYRLETKRDGFALESRTDRFERYSPLEIENLFSIFAEDTAPSAKGIHGFCNTFGLLEGGGPRRSRPTYEGTVGSDLLRHHGMIHRALDLFRQGDPSGLVRYWNSALGLGHGMALVHTELRVGPEGRLEMVFAPPDLISAMWLQFAQFACSQAQLFRCQRCGKPFLVGTGTGRRNTAKFCSNACKVAAFRERQEATK